MNTLNGPLQGLASAEASFNSAAEKISKSFVVDPQHPQDQVSLSDAMVAFEFEERLRSQSEIAED